MSISGSSFGVRRRAFLGAGLAAGAVQVFSPFVRTARAAEAVKIGLDNPLTGPLASLGKNELIGCQMAIDAINAKGGNPWSSRSANRRGLDQRGCRDCGHEGAQADRRRQGRLPARQRQLGAFARHGAGVERKGHPSYRPRGAHRRGYWRWLPLERVPRLQHHADGGEHGRRRAQRTERNSITLRRTTPSAILSKRGL